MGETKSVLMISGSGRSGTTILSLLFAQAQDVLNIGQVRDIWAGWKKDVTCACERPLNKCDLWGEVRARVCADFKPEDYSHTQKQMRQFMRDAAELEDWSDKGKLLDLSERHSGFLSLFGDLLDALFDISGASLLVDSSKSPEIALAVHLTAVADVYVLNVARDPRAVACSWHKKGNVNVPKMMKAWLDREKRLAGWPAADRLKHRTLRYEDFATRPEESIRNVLMWVNKQMPPDLFDAGPTARIDWDGQHIFPPSNERVLSEKLDVQQIKAPVSWKSAENWRIHLTALRYTFPRGLFYIFGLRSR